MGAVLSVLTQVGFYNTAIGKNALYSNTIADSNTATGESALYTNTGYRNTANGTQALFANTTGNYNTAIGYRALNYNITGEGNTATGYYAGDTGSYNTSNGYEAGSGSGSYNICVGYYAGFYNVFTANNQIAIGITTGTGGANKAIIGNSSQTWIGGQVDFSAISDARIKEQVQADVPGLNFIKELRPVTYHPEHP